MYLMLYLILVAYGAIVFRAEQAPLSSGAELSLESYLDYAMLGYGLGLGLGMECLFFGG